MTVPRVRQLFLVADHLEGLVADAVEPRARLRLQLLQVERRGLERVEQGLVFLMNLSVRHNRIHLADEGKLCVVFIIFVFLFVTF